MPQDEAPDGANKLFNLNGLDITVPLGQQIHEFQKTLVFWNSKINITRNDSGERFLIENILDPIISCNNYAAFDENYLTLATGEAKTLNLIDLGCGGGFVGLFWTIWLKKLYPTLLIKTTLLDAQRKRVSFCTEVARALGLSDSIQCLHARAETILTEHQQAFDVIVSRATWDFSTFVKMAQPFARKGGRIVSFEGPKGLDAIKKAGTTVLEYKVLPTDHSRFLGVVQN